jgi:hypothetical protein
MVWKEEVSKNWKSRREKPPDKVVTMSFEIVNRKEYNRLYESLKMDIKKRRKEEFCIKKERKYILSNYMEMKYIQDGGSSCNDDYCEAENKLEKMQQYCSVVGSVNHNGNLVKSEVDANGCEQVFDLLRLVTESSIWVLMGCILNKEETTVPRVQVGAENETNTNLFVGVALMDDGQIMHNLVWFDSSDRVIFKNNFCNGVEEAVDMSDCVFVPYQCNADVVYKVLSEVHYSGSSKRCLSS